MAITELHGLTVSSVSRVDQGSAPARTEKGKAVVEQSKLIPKKEEERISEAQEVEKKKSSDLAEVVKLVEQVNGQPQVQHRALQFNVNKDTGTVIVRVYNPETDEVIREIPPEQMIAIAERISRQLAELKKGVILEDRA